MQKNFWPIFKTFLKRTQKDRRWFSKHQYDCKYKNPRRHCSWSRKWWNIRSFWCCRRPQWRNVCFLVFLNHPTIFEAIRVWDRIENFTGKRRIWAKLKIQTKQKARERNSGKIKRQLLEVGKERWSAMLKNFVMQIVFYYVRYPEGNPRSISKYKEGEERISHVVERPIEEVFLLYTLSEGRASVKHTRRISIERMNEIKRTFIVDVLQKKFNEELAGKQFAMEKFLDEEFGTNLKEKAGAQSDDVEFIKVRKIAWKQRSASGQKVTFQRMKIMSWTEMYKLLRQHNVSSAYVLVRSVEIQVKFPGKGKIGSHRLTFDFQMDSGLEKTNKA